MAQNTKKHMLKTEVMYVQSNIEVCSHNNCCCGKAICITTL